MNALERFTAGLTPEPWKADAACRGMDTALFFPSSNEPTPEVEAICDACPVQETCRDYGLERKEHGVWGGTSHRWRIRYRETSMGLPKHGTWDRFYNHGCHCLACCAEASRVRRLAA